MGGIKIKTAIIAVGLSVVATIALVKPTSAYVIECPDKGVDSAGYAYVRCITSSYDVGYQVSVVCANFLGAGGYIKLGPEVRSGHKSRVKCGFLEHVFNGRIGYQTVYF